MILRLGLDDKVIVHRYGRRFYLCHRKELLIYMLHNLAFRIPQSFLGPSVFGGDDSRYGAGYNFALMHLDKSVSDLENINSLACEIFYYNLLQDSPITSC